MRHSARLDSYVCILCNLWLQWSEEHFIRGYKCLEVGEIRFDVLWHTTIQKLVPHKRQFKSS